MILPTAYTHPEGTVYVTSFEIVLLQLGYALSDTTQITLSATPPLGSEDVIFLTDLSLKSAFVRDGPVRAAAIGSVSGLMGLEQGNFLLGRVGAVTELCLDHPCESSVTMGANALLAGPAVLMVGGAGVIWRLASWGALVVEVDTALPLGREAAEFNGIAVIPAFRFPFRTWALDLGVARPLDVDEPVSVLPIVVFSYRFLP